MTNAMTSDVQESNYHIERRDNVLYVEIQGPFDGVIAEQYHIDMLSISRQMKAKPWASLVKYHRSGLFTPDAEKALIETTKFRVKNNMIANATVISENTHADTQQMQLRRIYSSCALPFYVFSDVRSAETWLESYLAKQVAS